MIQAAGPALLAALRVARQALADSYNVNDHPGDGTSDQDEAIKIADAAIQSATGKDADGCFVSPSEPAGLLPASMLGTLSPSTLPSDPMARAVRRIADQFCIDTQEVTPDMKLEGYADSLDTVELAMALEDEFDIVIDDVAAMAAKTVADVFELLRKRGVAL